MKENENFIHRSQYNALKVSSASCSGCMLFMKAFNLATTGRDLVKDSTLRFMITNGEFQTDISNYPHRTIRQEVFMLPSSISLPNLRTASIIPPCTNLDLNITNIEQWLQGYENSYTQCGEQSDYLPMRPMELEIDDSSIKLIETAMLPVRTPNACGNNNYRYACLSHCSGKSRSKHLTKRENLHSNQSSIPIIELPKTFQGAILVSRALKLCYIWIDSLCMIQDDIKDWEIHVEAMADIYRSAYITLAAGASEDDEGGFLRVAEKIYSDSECVIVTRYGQEHKNTRSI